ncbi:BTB/POZ domain protein POB1 [Heracleum sosnowskyi]|uniref:BTB/POZ domain protein POB1 n=1 Tax=Heracleum sosnowskyi TaxID=360622 RepID=A0AAD8MMN9_9APIA|nr:BTB/POZ domain protein POB1 [Heracleum sosnowskyi]
MSTRFENQVLNLPLAGIEALLASDDIQVPLEDVYDLVIKWAELHYPQLEERREILETRLRHLIRFPYMTSGNFKQLITGTNFSPEVASKIIFFQALLSKTEAPNRQSQLSPSTCVSSKTSINTTHHFVKRAYEYFPVKIVGVELPHHHCVVNLDVKWEDCVRLFPGEYHHSEAFYLCRQSFCLTAQCNMDGRNKSQCFGLALRMLERGFESVEVEYEFAAWSKKDGYMTEDGPYFVNGTLVTLHLRAEVTIKK